MFHVKYITDMEEVLNGKLSNMVYLCVKGKYFSLSLEFFVGFFFN